MAIYFLDTSALVKLYVREQGTDRLLALTERSSGNRFAILGISRVEFRSAVRRRERSGEIPAAIATQLLAAFERHVEGVFVTQAVTDYVLDQAMTLIDHYALRAFDAVQLAGYIVLKNSAGSDIPVFVCSDHVLLSAAVQEGLSTFDPCV